MRNVALALLGLLAVVLLSMGGILLYERAYVSSTSSGEMPLLQPNHELVTVNTTRIGSDDPIEMAVSVAQIVYPATESENIPGAVILVNRSNLAEVMVAASRVQHFPVNAPLLYVDEDSLPELTRSELLRLGPEGVPADDNVQVYLVGTIGDGVRQEVEELGFHTRVLWAENPVDLAIVADDWTSTQHADHENHVIIANLDNLEAAIPGAFWNAHEGDGLAFVTNEGVPEATRELLLRRAHGPWIYVFGDESVVSAETVRALAQVGHVTRVTGSTPTEISASFASFHDEGENWGAWLWQDSRSFGWGIDDPGHNAIVVRLDGPGGWQNAIVATTLSHMGKHAPVLIFEGEGVPEPVTSYLEDTKPYPTAAQQQLLNHAWIIGGEGTIDWETQVEIDGLLEAYPLQETGGATAGGGQ